MKRNLLLLLFAVTTLFSSASNVRWFDGKTAVSYQMMTPTESVVRTAAGMFEDDMKSVTGMKSERKDNAQILLYQLSSATETQKNELRKKGVDIQFLSSKTDAFQLKVVSGQKIIIAGSNGRGVAYGLLEMSRIAGVTPWIWWGDVVPEKKQTLCIDSKTNIKQKASVEMRGIFLNDEDWSLRNWSTTNFSPSTDGIISADTYRKIFELLLRLRANTIWPAMHEGTRAFFRTPGAKAVADSCGIFIGSSHCEPLLRNNVDEWDVKKRGAFNYITNKKAVQDYWTERLKEVRTSSSNIFTIGMRGIHDGSMEGVKTMDEKFNALQQVIDDQQKLIAENIGNPSEQPQVFVPYKEVLELYEKGLNIPDYVTLMWCDDNYGYITRLSTPEEQKRSGGAGVYYHLSYWGRPHDYLWLTTTQPGLICSEMLSAYNHNARKLWIANTHDVKVAGYDLELFLDMAWNINSVNPSALGSHYKQWLSSLFGTDVAENIYPAMREFYRLTAERKPEHMGWNQVEMDKKTFDRGISPVRNTEFTPSAFGNELERYLAAFDEIEGTILHAANKIRPELADAFFAHIVYPVSAASANAHKVLEAQKARTIVTSVKSSDISNPENPAVQASAKSMYAYKKIVSLTEQYNSLSNGKWKGLMDMQPRWLPIFMAPSLPIIPEQLEKPVCNHKHSVPTNDFICHSASDYTSAGNGIKVIDMLGHSMKAVQLPKGQTLSYSFSCDKETDAILTTALIPTQPNDNGDIRYAVSIDGGEETIFSLKEKFRSEQWKLNVLRQQTLRKQNIHLSAGEHTLTLRALDNHIIIDQWMIDFNTKRGNYYLLPGN